jgi:glycosyltransferase involved in cell wall biosynthesis
MWAFTGGCHYADDCDHFTHTCGDCWMLKGANENDLSHAGWLRKLEMYRSAKNIVFVTCSTWLAGVANKSSLLKDFRVEAIPNPIDTEIFSPKDKIRAREKYHIDPNQKIVLFGAANILDRRKGITYLVDALDELKKNYADLTDVAIVIFGKNKSFDVSQLPFKVYEMSLVGSQQGMAELYNLADVYVTPTIEDNLPNTVMESMACGTPVVAFNTGGLPDMVDHLNNGYLAEFKSATDLAAGIKYILTSNQKNELAANARKKVLDNFTNDIVAKKYLAVYESILQK